MSGGVVIHQQTADSNTLRPERSVILDPLSSGRWRSLVFGAIFVALCLGFWLPGANAQGVAKGSIPGAMLDFGDAPTGGPAGEPADSYPTLFAEDGACHVLSGPTLGSSVDQDEDGQPNGTATGDDTDDGGDDEDGVVFSPALFSSTLTPATGFVDVELGSADPVQNLLNAWIDFNRDGDWDDDGEQVFTDLDLGTSNGNQRLSFTIPQDTGSNVVSGTTFARFRLDSAGGLTPRGHAPNGEVEDYMVDLPEPAQIEATKTDSLLVDADGDGKPSPGDTLRYTISLSNTGALDAVNIRLRDRVDLRNFALVSNSISFLPVANDDAYVTTTDVQLVVSARGVLENDIDLDSEPAPISVGFADTTSLGGGTVNVSPNGGFVYDPAPEFVGMDSFGYEATDGSGTDTATVSILVVGFADVGVTISDDLDPADVGDIVTYTVFVVNYGSRTAPDVVVTNTFSSSVSIGEPTSSLGVCVSDGQRRICTIGDMAANSSATITFPVTPTVPDIPITAAVHVVTSTFDTNVNNNTAFEETLVSVGGPPNATNDTYDGIGNVGINVPEASGVLANDGDPDMDFLTVTSFDSFSAQSGVVQVATNGAFTYHPPAGFAGVDSFTYEVFDGGLTDTGTVSVTVSNMIWFIDNAADAGGDGTLAAPFSALVDFVANANVAEKDIIFVDEGDGTSSGLLFGLGLQDNQQLIGQGVDLASSIGITFPPHTLPLPGIAGRPTLGSMVGPGITLASNNIVRGLNVLAANGAGIVGSSVGALTVDNVSVDATGGAGVDLQGGSIAVTLDSLRSTASLERGIRLAHNSGTFTAIDGSVSDAIGNGIDIDGGNATITYTGSISNSTGRSISIANVTGGTVTLSGSINDSGGGINLFGNTGGSMISFSGTNKVFNVGTNIAVEATGNDGSMILFDNGGLDIDTDGIGFSFVGDNRVQVMGSNNTITATSAGIGLQARGGGTIELTGNLQIDTSAGTGPAIDIQDTTIGVSGVMVQSASAGANPGIVLRNTGNTGGGLHVTGSGTENSGGVIRGSATAGLRGNGVDLMSTANVVLEHMRLENANEAAISIQDVTNFQLLESVLVDGIANPAAINEAGILINGLFGQSLIQDVQCVAISGNGVEVVSTTADDEVADELTIRRVTFSGYPSDSGRVGIDYRPAGSSQTRLLVESCSFTNKSGGTIAVSLSPSGSNSTDVIVRDCDMNDAGSSGSGGIQVGASEQSFMNCLIEDSRFIPLEVRNNDFALMNMTVRSNEFNNLFDFDTAIAIAVHVFGGEALVELSDNTINARTEDRVMEAVLSHTSENDISVLDLSIIGNTFAEPDSDNRASGIILESDGANRSGARLRAKVEGNNGEVTGGFAGAFFDFGEGIGIAERQGSTFELELGVSTSSVPVAVLGDNNPGIMLSAAQGGLDLFIEDNSGSVAVVTNGTVSVPGLPSEPGL